MDKELALRTFGYLIGHYKTHDETIINSQEIEAIEFILKNNEDLEQQCKKQKEVIDKATEYITKEKNNYLHHVQKAIGKCIDDKGNINSNTAGLLLSAAVNTCDCTLNILNGVSE